MLTLHHERDSRRATGGRSSVSAKPSKTLFVINFDPIYTRTRDLERHFEEYGKIVNIRIRRNFALVQFESEDEASKALEATNMSKLMDRVITVEYAIRDDDDRRNGYSPDRRGGRDASPISRASTSATTTSKARAAFGLRSSITWASSGYRFWTCVGLQSLSNST